MVVQSKDSTHTVFALTLSYSPTFWSNNLHIEFTTLFTQPLNYQNVTNSTFAIGQHSPCHNPISWWPCTLLAVPLKGQLYWAPVKMMQFHLCFCNRNKLIAVWIADFMWFPLALCLWIVWVWSCTKCIYHLLHSTIQPLYESQFTMLYL